MNTCAHCGVTPGIIASIDEPLRQIVANAGEYGDMLDRGM